MSRTKSGGERHFQTLAQGQTVRVSLEYLSNVQCDSFEERREVLIKIFQQIAVKLGPFGVKIDMNSLGVLGQHLEATVPVERLRSVKTALAGEPFRMKKQDLHYVLLD